MSIGIITSIKSIKEIIWPNFLTYQKYYDLCRSKVTAPNSLNNTLFPALPEIYQKSSKGIDVDFRSS